MDAENWGGNNKYANNAGKTGQRGTEQGDFFQLGRSEEDMAFKLASGYNTFCAKQMT